MRAHAFAQLAAVEARLRCHHFSVGLLRVAVAAGICLVAAPYRFIGHEIVDRGVGCPEVFHFLGGVELAVARLYVLGALRQHPLVGRSRFLGPSQI